MGQFMKGSFMFLKNCNIDPALCMRVLEGTYEKTILLIRGAGGSGKSTLANLMLHDEFYYLSMDMAMIDRESAIESILQFLNEYGDNAIYNIHILSAIIEEKCFKEFMDFFFQKYIIENDSSNIILDGYIFTFAKVFSLFKEKCRQCGYRLWDIKREV
jgi:adenylate kinase family enzyme